MVKTEPHSDLSLNIRAGVHASTKSVSASISLLPPVQTRSGVHTYRQNLSASISLLPPVQPRSGVHTYRQNLSAAAAISVVLIFHVIFMARQYTGPTGQSYQDESAPAVRTMPTYLSSGSPASRRHVGGRPDNFVVSAPCTACP
jgi:hypothetical protein